MEPHPDLNHNPGRRAVRQKNAGEVNVNDLLPLAQRHIHERLTGIDACGGDEDIHRAPGFDDASKRGVHAVLIGHITMQRQRGLPAQPLAFGGDLGRLIHHDVQHGDPCAFLGEPQAGRLADALCARR